MPKKLFGVYFHKQILFIMAYDYAPRIDVIRQNQTQNTRELLKAKGYINLLSSFEVMGYTELWVDYCLNGPTDAIKARFKQFDKLMEKRISEIESVVDGVIL